MSSEMSLPAGPKITDSFGLQYSASGLVGSSVGQYRVRRYLVPASMSSERRMMRVELDSFPRKSIWVRAQG